MIKLLFLSGSARKASTNKQLAKLAAKVAKSDDVQATYIDLADFEMPLYNGDWEDEHGLPENAIKLKKLFVEHDGFYIASPEYNSSMSSLLKNTLDWLSRAHEESETPLVAFNGKVAALGAVSPGGLGGMRGLVPLRMMLGNIGVTVVPTQAAVGSGFEAFADDGSLLNEMFSGMLQSSIQELVKTAQGLKQ